MSFAGRTERNFLIFSLKVIIKEVANDFHILLFRILLLLDYTSIAKLAFATFILEEVHLALQWLKFIRIGFSFNWKVKCLVELFFG
jgi:hypothetical protein